MGGLKNSFQRLNSVLVVGAIICTGTLIRGKSTQYDDAGKGIVDHTQSDVTVVGVANDNFRRMRWAA